MDTYTAEAESPPTNGHRAPFDPRRLADELRAQGLHEQAAIVGSADGDEEFPPAGALDGKAVLGYAFVPDMNLRLSRGRYEGPNSEFDRWMRGDRPRTEPLKTATRRGEQVLQAVMPPGLLAVLSAADGDVLEFDYVGDTVVVRKAG
jgi:hypothetical protein